MDNLAFVDIELVNNPNKGKKFQEPEKIYTFDEAVTLIGNGKFHKLLLLICGLCFMSVMIEIMGISLIMDHAKCDLNFTIYEQGMLASAGYLGVVLSSHAMGFLADTCGRVKTLKYSIIISFISSVISTISVNIWMLIVMRFLVGFFISGCQACVFSFVGEFHGKKTRTKSVTLLSTFLPLGLIFLPALALVVLPLNFELMLGTLKITSWRLLLLVNALPSLIAFIGLLFFPESPKYLLAQGDHKMALSTLRRVYSINTGKSEDDYPVKQIHLETSGANFSNVKNACDALKLIWSQTVPLFHRERVLHTLNLSVLMFLAYTIAQGTFMWFPSMLNDMVKLIDSSITVCEAVNAVKINNMDYKIDSSFNLTENEFTQIKLDSGNFTEMNFRDMNVTEIESKNCNKVDTLMFQVLMGMGCAYTVIYLIFSSIIVRVGKKPLLMAWIFICGIATLLLYWTTNFYLNVVLMTLCMAIGNGGGILSTISMEFFPTNINAMGMCFMLMIGRLGAVAGSNIIGIILKYNCQLLFLIFGCVILLLLPLAYLTPTVEYRKNKK